MNKMYISIILTCIMLSVVQTNAFQQQQPVKLTQTVTKALPVNMKAYVTPAFIAMAKDNKPNAVIVKVDKQGDSDMALTIQKSLKNKWGILFPIVDYEAAKKSDKNLILYGHVNANTPLRQLNANSLVGNNEFGYEVRTIINALDWKKDVIYIGGNTHQEIEEGLKVLLEKVSNPSKIAYLISCKGWDKRATQKEVADLINGMKSHYAKDDANRSQLAIRDLLKVPANAYLMTGDDAYVKAFIEMQNIVFQNYGKSRLGKVETPPSFIFHLYPQYIYAVENSTVFTAQDRLKSAEFMRLMVEQMMLHWELKDPLLFYKESRQDYLTNHSSFACRSVSSSARYLNTRYNYEPAKFWIAVADNGFAGVAPNPFSPEDAAGYQYLVYQIFIDYALASGQYDLNFFKNKTFTDYMHYSKFQVNHLGYTAGFGDANPIGHSSAYPILRKSIDILDDKESEYILNLMEKRNPYLVKDGSREIKKVLAPPGINSLGLNYQAVVPFKQAQYEVANYYKLPVLDKAVFRNGWDDNADFLSITGINGDGYNHGHFDANGISQYISGDRLWLWEGDYIRKFPNDHNSIVVSRNGKLTDQSRSLVKRRKSSLSQVKTAINNKDRSLSLLSMLLEDYNGVNWTRNINFAGKGGFWVIDELDIQQDGHYITEAYWRSIGTMEPKDQTVKFVQRKSDDKNIANHFFITEGNGASRFTKTMFEAGHGRKDGFLTAYKFGSKNTKQVIQRLNGDYKKGDKQLFVNFLQAIPGGAPKAPIIKKISPEAFIAESNNVLRLAVLNNFNNDQVNITAEACFIGPEGIIARGATRIKIGGLDWKSETKTDIALDLPEGLTKDALNSLLVKLGAKGELVKPQALKNLEVKNEKVSAKINNSTLITSVAAGDEIFATGAQDGTFTLNDNKGVVISSHKFPSAISAISAVPTATGLFWAVATVPESLKTAEGKVHLLNAEAEVLWKMPIPTYQKRNGTVNTLFTANLGPQNGVAIIAGAESWHYYAFSISGKQLWKQPIFHGATVGAAGDMDGNGVDDIAAGGEYYYHSTILNGKVLPHKTTSPWDYSVAVTDLNNDKLKEAVYGRGDGFIYVEAAPANPIRNWRLNVGGRPIAIVAIENNAAKIAVANELGDIVFVTGDGASTKTVHLPAAITDMKLFNGKLLASAIDGFVYVVDLNGAVLAKYAYEYDIDSFYKPAIAVSGNTAIVFSGRKTFYIN
jgi:hypothetical protein